MLNEGEVKKKLTQKCHERQKKMLGALIKGTLRSETIFGN